MESMKAVHKNVPGIKKVYAEVFIASLCMPSNMYLVCVVGFVCPSMTVISTTSPCQTCCLMGRCERIISTEMYPTIKISIEGPQSGW